MHNVKTDPEWTTTDPVKAGTFFWRKNWQWEAVPREVRQLPDGTLVTYAHRYVQWCPLNRVGGEWLIADLKAHNALPAPKNNCVACKSLFRS